MNIPNIENVPDVIPMTVIQRLNNSKRTEYEGFTLQRILGHFKHRFEQGLPFFVMIVGPEYDVDGVPTVDMKMVSMIIANT